MLLASGGDFGSWPDDFDIYDVAEEWHCPPWIAENAPLHYFERALLRRAVIAEGRAAYTRNQRGSAAGEPPPTHS